MAQGREYRAAWLLCAGLLLPTSRSAGETSATLRRIHLIAGADAAAVGEALAEARSRLDTPACQGLLTEFASQDGRPLAVVLEERHETVASSLDQLTFDDGSGAELCRNRARFAFTVPRSPSIHVCPGFAGVLRRYPEEAVATLIHEALHSLGLGENPPSSRHIQDRVLARCFRPQPSRELKNAAARQSPRP